MLNLLLNKWIDRLARRIAAQQQPHLRIIGNSNLGYRRVGDLLTFYAATSLATGARNDADSAPTYIIYEEENATEIVTSTSMALLDASTTDGLYSEQVTLAEATGYEFQKDYLVYITATVSSIVSHAMYSFRIGPEGALASANAQAGAAGSITLASAASTTDDMYTGLVVAIIGGSGVGQSRVITDYVGSTRVATIEPNWISTPTSSSIYALFHAGRVAVHTDGITDASLATEAITADAIATDAVNEIAAATTDQVWDEPIAGHLSAGSTGEALDNAGGGATPAAIADAVWDELRAGHVVAGSFGEGVASVQGNVTGNVVGSTGSVVGNVGGNVVGSVGSVTGNVGGNVVGSVGSIAPGGLTAASTDATFTTELEDTVWDATLANHLDAGSTGEALNDAAAGGATPAAIADAVWDELRAGHVVAGSFGEGVASVQGNVTGSVGSVTGNVGGNVVGSVGSVVGNLGGNVVGNVNGNVVGSVGSVAAGGITAPSFAAGAIDAAAVATNAIDADALATDAVNEIAAATTDQVWDEPIAGHLVVGSTGEALNNAAAGGATPAAIADAVWDELRAGHVLAGSFGEGVASVQGNVTGSVGSVTGNVGGSVGSVVGSVGSVVGNVGGNVVGSTGSVVGNVGGNVVGSVGSVAAGGITAPSFAAGAITAAATDATFATELEDTVWDAPLANHLDVGSTGEALDNASTGGGGTDWTGSEREQIRQALGVTGVVAATTGAGTLELAAAAINADTDDIQARLPATLNGGRMRSHVEACDPPCTGGGGGATADDFEAVPG